jgi:hypothetical protein
MNNGEIPPIEAYDPCKGNPVVMLVWDEKEKTWKWKFDNKVFTNLEFIVSGLRSCLDVMERNIRMTQEFNFQRAMAEQINEQMRAQHLANQLRGR